MRTGPPLGHRIVHEPEAASTNDLARDLAARGAEEGTVARADVQRAGRGRQGRAWASPAGGLWFSVVLRPEAPVSRWGLLPLAVGLGVATALQARGARALVKWPNDVLVDGRKVAGVLCEARPPAFVVAGVGVNANVDVDALPDEARRVAGSLLARGGPHDLDALLRDVLSDVDAAYRALERGDVESVLASYRKNSATLGARVRTASGVDGRAIDVLEDGRLLVEHAAGARVTLAADDVHLA